MLSDPAFRSSLFTFVITRPGRKMSIFTGLSPGIANKVLGWFGIDPIEWLSVPQPPRYWVSS